MVNKFESRRFKDLPRKYFRKIAFSQTIFTCIAIAITALTARSFLKSNYYNNSKEQLQNSLELIKHTVISQNISPIYWCFSLKNNKGNRYTLVDISGKVLCDTVANELEMDNHKYRPEIKEAFESGYGTIIRKSKTLNKEMLYGATTLYFKSDIYVLRGAISLTQLNKTIALMDNSIIIIIFPLMVILGLFSLWGGLKYAIPLRSLFNKIDKMENLTPLDHSNFVIGLNDEWALIEKTLDNAKKDLEKHVEDLYIENEKISKLMSSISDKILAIDKKGNILFANEQFMKLFFQKVYSSNEISNFKIWELIRDNAFQNLFQDVFNKEKIKKVKNFEWQSKYYFDVIINPLRTYKGEVTGSVAVFHDISDYKMAQQMREDFVANVSHEIRTPLTAIKGYTQIVKNLVKNEDKAQELLDRIEFNVDRTTNLFNDILQLSVIESNRVKEKKKIKTIDFTTSIARNISMSYKSKNIKLSIHADDNATELYCVPDLTEQIIKNLIENAYKYTHDNSEILVDWIYESQRIHLKVKDSGIGIDQKHLPRLFERFYRVDASRSREMGGTGLGLAIVKHAVSAQGAKIQVESSLGEGSTFHVTFPKSP